jgi:hypothetical protein
VMATQTVMHDLLVTLMREMPERESVLSAFESERKRLHATLLHSRHVSDEWLESLQLNVESIIEASRRKPGASIL